MSKRKITITTGTRAEYGILRPILKEILTKKNLELYLIVTGTHLSKKHGMTINEIKKDGFKISKKIESLPKGNTAFEMTKSIGTGISNGINFNEIIVHNIKSGKPNIKLLGNTKKIVNKILNKKKFNIFLSLSDDKPFAVATVVISI